MPPSPGRPSACPGRGNGGEGVRALAGDRFSGQERVAGASCQMPADFRVGCPAPRCG